MKTILCTCLILFSIPLEQVRGESRPSAPSEEEVYIDYDQMDPMKLPIGPGIEELEVLPPPVMPSAPPEELLQEPSDNDDWMRLPIDDLDNLEVLQPPKQSKPRESTGYQNMEKENKKPQQPASKPAKKKVPAPSYNTEKKKHGNSHSHSHSNGRDYNSQYHYRSSTIPDPVREKKKNVPKAKTIRKKATESANLSYRSFKSQEGIQLRKRSSFIKGLHQGHKDCDTSSCRRDGENEAYRLIQEQSERIIQTEVAKLARSQAQAEALSRHRDALANGFVDRDLDELAPLSPDKTRGIRQAVKSEIMSLKNRDSDKSSDVNEARKLLGLSSLFFRPSDLNDYLSGSVSSAPDLWSAKNKLHLGYGKNAFFSDRDHFYRDLDSESQKKYRETHNSTIDKLLASDFVSYIASGDIEAFQLGLRIGGSIRQKDSYLASFRNFLERNLQLSAERVQASYEDEYELSFRRELNAIDRQSMLECDLRLEFSSETLPEVRLVGSIANIGGKKRPDMSAWESIKNKNFIWKSHETIAGLSAHTQRNVDIVGTVEFLGESLDNLIYSIPSNKISDLNLRLTFTDLANMYSNLDDENLQQKDLLLSVLLSRVKLEWQVYSSWFRPDIWSDETSQPSLLHELLHLSQQGSDFSLLAEQIENLSRPLRFLYPKKNRNFKNLLEKIKSPQ